MVGRRVGRYAGATGVVALVVAGLWMASWINDRTATIFLLLAVMVCARTWGWGPGLVSAGFAALAFIYFVLPPVGFTIHDPNDWLALASFVVGAGLAGAMMALAQRSEQQRQHFRDLYWDLLATHKREMAQRGLEHSDAPRPSSDQRG